MIRQLLPIAGILFICASAYPIEAQHSKPTATPVEVVELRAQLETVRDYQDRFIAIVQWSLGAVVTMAIALLAFGWFTNKTNYERDRDAVRQEREALRHELRAFLSDEVRRVTQELNAKISESEKPMQQRIEKATQEKIQQVSARLDSVVSGIREVEFANLERDAKEALRENNPRWAIYKYCDMLDLSVKQQTDYYEVPDILDDIRNALETPNIKMFADDVTKTVETLKRLPAKYHPAAEKLIEMVKRLQ